MKLVIQQKERKSSVPNLLTGRNTFYKDQQIIAVDSISSTGTMYDMDLLRRANPVLFSPERYDEYPLGYDDLMQYLSTKDITSQSDPQHNRPYTYIDSLDFLLYSQDEDEIDIDLDKKLACEYALYYAQSKKRQNKHKRMSLLGSRKYLDDLLYGGANHSRDWYEAVITMLENLSITELDPDTVGKLERLVKTNKSGVNVSMLSHNMNGFQKPEFPRSRKQSGSGLDLMRDNNGSHSEVFSGHTLNESDDTMEEESQGIIQDLISYLISNSIKRGINVKPTNLNNPVEFLKGAIDEILDAKTDSLDNKPQDRSSNIDTLETSVTPVNFHEADTNELKTALNDLQLAHSFLTKQFETSRLEQSQTINRLTKTNRELQDKLLKYHAKISKLEEKLKVTEDAKTQLEDAAHKINMKENLLLSSPIMAPELFSPSTPTSGLNSSPSNNNSHSITVMRNEFKRMILETQDKYEKELAEEREKRLKLEKEFEELKD